MVLRAGRVLLATLEPAFGPLGVVTFANSYFRTPTQDYVFDQVAGIGAYRRRKLCWRPSGRWWAGR